MNIALLNIKLHKSTVIRRGWYLCKDRQTEEKTRN